MGKQNGQSKNGQSKTKPDPQPQKIGSGGGGNAEYLSDVVEPGVERENELPPALQNLLSKDYPLANIRREDREYFRLLSENVAHYVREQFPPEDSLIQGELGAALLEDPEYDVSAKTTGQINQYETILMDSFARTSRGEAGWQQEKFTESIQTRRVEDNREEEDSGFLGGMF
jgi:hypothetical protein